MSVGIYTQRDKRTPEHDRKVSRESADHNQLKQFINSYLDIDRKLRRMPEVESGDLYDRLRHDRRQAAIAMMKTLAKMDL